MVSPPPVWKDQRSPPAWCAAWKLLDGSLSHPVIGRQLVPVMSLFCLLQIITIPLMCARLSGSALKSIASFDLGFCSWTRACNLGLTERPAQSGGAGAQCGFPGVGTQRARSGLEVRRRARWSPLRQPNARQQRARPMPPTPECQAGPPGPGGGDRWRAWELGDTAAP